MAKKTHHAISQPILAFGLLLALVIILTLFLGGAVPGLEMMTGYGG